jgi:hypothetical protein
VSVIVAARDAEADVRRLCECLQRQTADPEAFELLIVDDGSIDGTAQAVAAAEPRAQLIRLPRAGGPYPARNVAAARSRGQLLAFTDVDALPTPHWVENGMRAFEHPAVDMIGGAIRIPLDDRPSAVALVDAARHLDQELYYSFGFAATANMWVRRAVFEELGGFEERLLSGGDGDFGRRAKTAGKRLEYHPEVAVDHPPRERAGALIRKGYRLGIGSAQQSRLGAGPFASFGPPWRRPRAYLPRRRLEGLHRLEASGHAPGRFKQAQLLLVEHLFLTVPVIVGSLVGDLRYRFRNRGIVDA